MLVVFFTSKFACCFGMNEHQARSESNFIHLRWDFIVNNPLGTFLFYGYKGENVDKRWRKEQKWDTQAEWEKQLKLADELVAGFFND